MTLYSLLRWNRAPSPQLVGGGLLLAVLLGTTVSVGAQVRKQGPEFLANWYIAYDQTQPRLVVLDPSRCLIVWTGWDPELGGLYGIRGRIFNRSLGSIGDEFLISISAEFDRRIEDEPALTTAGPGGFVAAWRSSGTDLSDITAQVFRNDGSAKGEAVQANQSTGMDQRPAVAANADGGFIVAWESVPAGDNYSVHVRARTFSPLGIPTSDEFGLALDRGWTRDVSAAADAAGNFILVWQEDGVGIVGQRVDTTGEPLTLPFLVSASDARSPAIAISKVGSFVVLWQSYSANTGYDISGRRFAGDGSPLGDEFSVNSYTDDQQVFPSIATDDVGELIVLWESFASTETFAGGQDGSGRGVFGQYLDPEGRHIGGEFQANTYTTRDQGGLNYRGSAVAMWPDGGFVGAWESEGDGFNQGIFGQMFNFDASLRSPCGDTNDDLLLTARDALQVLRASVDLASCDLCVCDVDSSGTVTTTDARMILRAAIGDEPPLACVSCAR